MPNKPRLTPRVPRLVPRRSLLATAVVVPGVITLAGCKDDAPAAGTPDAVNPTSSDRPTEKTLTVDPAVVAALSAAATQVTQLSLGYAGVSRKFPALRTQLAAGAKYHASHLAKLKETAGVAAAAGKAPTVPGTSSAALTALANQEKAAATVHATAAAKLSGASARLLAMIAAAETQLATALTPKKANAS